MPTSAHFFTEVTFNSEMILIELLDTTSAPTGAAAMQTGAA